jgi:hypothetical protein
LEGILLYFNQHRERDLLKSSEQLAKIRALSEQLKECKSRAENDRTS